MAGTLKNVTKTTA